MGLTAQSTGAAADGDLKIERRHPDEKIIALAGNPNVGKSTVFNALTGMNQHTGNWPGKTVATAQGHFRHNGVNFRLVDLPGTYSLTARSAEEEVARDFICFGGADCAVVVADATCLERNLNLVLQVLECRRDVVVCVNLMDEAANKGICPDLDELSLQLGVPVVGTSARSGDGLSRLCDEIHLVSLRRQKTFRVPVRYPDQLEYAAGRLEPLIGARTGSRIDARWAAIRMLDPDSFAGEPDPDSGGIRNQLAAFLGIDLLSDAEISAEREQLLAELAGQGFGAEEIRDGIASALVCHAEQIIRRVVKQTKPGYSARDRKLDRLLTSRATGIPAMLLLLGIIFWLTITGANYPSALLSQGFSIAEGRLLHIANIVRAPEWLSGLLIGGIWRTVSWVVSVMLPPMAIFFPLFTLLEDLGYLPRVAFNLDRHFKKAGAHGKQALTMCMGFGCNACGVVGCRIIDSPRERLIAILTNNFVPCNGRFPTLIAVITMFFAASAGFLGSVASAAMLTGIILLGVLCTLLASRLLSRTVLRGIPSSFALELPPYRKPQIGKVLVRSVFDRTLFVLGRAVAVAAPAGALIWTLANLHVGGTSLLSHFTGLLDPFARAIGLDGVILMAFLLGFPANELVFPLMIMGYLSTGTLAGTGSLVHLREILLANGWTWVTAVCTLLFTLLHFPCATTMLTIRKEAGGLKWTALAFLLPTAAGIALCFAIASAARLFSWI